jgi:hypothetical protein
MTVEDLLKQSCHLFAWPITSWNQAVWSGSDWKWKEQRTLMFQGIPWSSRCSQKPQSYIRITLWSLDRDGNMKYPPAAQLAKSVDKWYIDRIGICERRNLTMLRDLIKMNRQRIHCSDHAQLGVWIGQLIASLFSAYILQGQDWRTALFCEKNWRTTRVER